MGEQIVRAWAGCPPLDVHFNFNNTGREVEETLVFVNELDKRWGVGITWIEFDATYGNGLTWRVVDFHTASRNGEPFDKMLTYYDRLRAEEKSEAPILPNPVNRMCTDRMKIKASAWWMKSMGYERWDAIIGIRADEPRRYTRMTAANGKERWENVMPMYEAGVTQETVQAFWKDQDIDLGIDSDLGNCDLCFLKHENKLLRAMRIKPELADWWIAHEERTGQRFRRDRAGYKELKFVAMQMNKQLPISFEEENLADCICGE